MLRLITVFQLCDEFNNINELYEIATVYTNYTTTKNMLTEINPSHTQAKCIHTKEYIMSFLNIYSLPTFFMHKNFKKHCNLRTEISPITFQNTLPKNRQKYKKLYVFKVNTATLNRMRISVCHDSNVYLI